MLTQEQYALHNKNKVDKANNKKSLEKLCLLWVIFLFQNPGGSQNLIAGNNIRIATLQTPTHLSVCQNVLFALSWSHQEAEQIFLWLLRWTVFSHLNETGMTFLLGFVFNNHFMKACAWRRSPKVKAAVKICVDLQ